MEVFIWEPNDSTDTIDGFTIVVDIFRAFSTAYYIMDNNPLQYRVVDSTEEAFALKNRIPNTLLIGERGGIKIPGFDFGNSPTEMRGRNFSGRCIVHTTSAGTKGLLRQKKENHVIVGGFLNCSAMLAYIQTCGISTVHIFCTAMKSSVSGNEDLLFAEYFKKRLLGMKTDYEEIRMTLYHESRIRFSEMGTAPATDFEYCLALDRFDSIIERSVTNNPNDGIRLTKM